MERIEGGIGWADNTHYRAVYVVLCAIERRLPGSNISLWGGVLRLLFPESPHIISFRPSYCISNYV
jgi:hypothetical protein